MPARWKRRTEEKDGAGEWDTNMRYEDRNCRQCIVSACSAPTFCLKQAHSCLMYPPRTKPIAAVFTCRCLCVILCGQNKTETTSNPTEETTSGIASKSLRAASRTDRTSVCVLQYSRKYPNVSETQASQVWNSRKAMFRISRRRTIFCQLNLLPIVVRTRN